VSGEDRPGRGLARAGLQPALAGRSESATVGAPPQRLVTRMVLEFLIRVMAASARAHGGDFKATVVFMAIQHANIEYMESDPDLSALYFGSYPPDTLRRPISVHALSQSLSLPPETCRRYVQRLIKQGYCRRVEDRGVIVPSAVMAQEPFATWIEATDEAFAIMLADFDAIGFDVLGASGSRAPNSGASPCSPLVSSGHALSAIMTGYLMRVILDGVGIHEKDFIRGLIFITVMAMNVEDDITRNRDNAWRFADAQSAPPDDMRRPVTVKAVSARLGLAYETTRQHLIRQLEVGQVVRVGGGFIIPTAVIQDPRNLKSGFNIYRWLLRAVAQLDRLGFDFDASIVSDKAPLAEAGLA
jgi:hypothetical protein